MAPFRIPTNGIADSSVTEIKLAGNVKAFSTYNQAPLTSTTTLGVNDTNQIIYLGHNATGVADNYTVILPSASLTTDGDWFTFVANTNFSVDEQSFLTDNANDYHVIISGVINGIATNTIKINEAYSSFTVVSYDNSWIALNISPGLTAGALSSINPQDALAKREFAGFVTYEPTVSTEYFAEPNSFNLAKNDNVVITLPPGPTYGDRVVVSLDGDTTSGVLVKRNGNTINGIAEDMTIDIPWATVTFRWLGNQWRVN